jgi:hypothetical protein
VQAADATGLALSETFEERMRSSIDLVSSISVGSRTSSFDLVLSSLVVVFPDMVPLLVGTWPCRSSVRLTDGPDLL